MSRVKEERTFTKEQRAAIESFGKNICVKAGAGSGKTTILVERFLHAVTQKKAEPERLLAITFTDKAANEMKTRLVEACRERSLHDLRRKLENASISTIHSFCAKILRENPIEAEVDPAFRVLGEGEAQLLADKVMDRSFEDLSASERWIALLSDYGEEPLREALKHFYDLCRATGEEKSLLRFGPDAGEIGQAREKIARRAGAILKRADAKASSALPKLKVWAAGIQEWAEKASCGGWEAIQLYRALWKRKPRKSPAVEEDLIDLEILFEGWLSREADRLAAPFKREFAASYLRFREAYDAEKRKLAAYDFEDLLRLTWKLLSGNEPGHKAVRKRLANSFAHVLVDEFQDTSVLQSRIIDLLRGPDNFFAVGDAQQSIYGFRHAAPEVFNALGGVKGDGTFERITLSDNYRARKEILAFVNGVFRSVFPEGRFCPLTPKRSFALPDRSPVEMLCVLREGDHKKLDHARVEEAARLARRLRELIDSGVEVQEKDGRLRPMRFGDVAVLFRGTEPMRFYEKAFMEAGIPYYVVKGKGFYDKQEVLDTLNFLKLLQDPRQDIPLAGVLRSPFVRISDDALLWLARAAKKTDDAKPLWDAFRALGKISELAKDDLDKLEAFRDRLCAMRDRKNRLTVSAIIRELLETAHYEAKLLTRPGGKQAIANVRKLLEQARSLEEKGITTADDFISFVKSLSEAEVVEAEAAVQSEESDSVKLFTIHKAKGLEFPCVAVADMGGKTERTLREVCLADVKFGLGMKIKDPGAPEYIEDTAFQAIAVKRKAAASEEEDRLLYVAMTRAKELLILSGALKPPRNDGKENTGSWMEKVASRVFCGKDFTRGELFEFAGVPIRLSGAAAGETRALPEKPRLADDPAVRAALFEGTPLKDADLRRIGWKPDPKAYVEFKNAMRPVERSYGESLDLTVTDLLLASAKGGDEKRALEEETVPPGDADDEDRTPRNEYGQIFHRVMEYLVSVRPAEFILTSFIKAWMRPLSEKERREMAESVTAFWKGPWGNAIRRSKRAYAELPFIYKTKYGVLKGQMDLVFETAGGEWVVLDYKTNRLEPAQKETLVRDYEFQLALYALVFRALYGESPRKGVLYFASIGEASERDYTEADFKLIGEKLQFHFGNVLRSRVGVEAPIEFP